MQAARGAPISASAPPQPDQPTAATRRRLRWLFAAVALLGLVLDLVTKVVAVARLEPLQPIRLLDGLLTLRLIRNPGAAFSAGESITWVFALAAIVVLVFILVRLVPQVGHPGWAVALGLLCAGVAGNLVDRLFRAPGVLRGHVVDFLQLPYWPIFNVADMCITGGAVMVMVLAVVKNIGLAGERYAAPARGSGAAAAGGPVEERPGEGAERG